jgi:hypothetical protein
LDSSTGELSGTPAFGQGGTYLFTLTATNATATVSHTYTLTVNQPPTITSADNSTNTTASFFQTTVGGTFVVTTSAATFPRATLTEVGRLPSGLQLIDQHNGTAKLEGTPIAGSGGVYDIKIVATNGFAPQAVQLYTLTVEQHATITSQNHITFLTGNAGAFPVDTFGVSPNATTFTETGATLPTGVTFDTSTGVLSGTPAAGTGGTYVLTLSASNGIGAAGTQVFTLTVLQPPSITSADTATITTGTSTPVMITTSGSPDAVISELGTLPLGVIFTPKPSNGTGMLSGKPLAGTGGVYNFFLVANNGVAPVAIQKFTLTVDEAAKIVSDPHETFSLGNPGTFQVQTTGFSSGSTTFTETGTLPAGESFDNSTGALTGTPTQTGTFALTLTANNGIGSTATQAFKLVVVEN